MISINSFKSMLLLANINKYFVALANERRVYRVSYKWRSPVSLEAILMLQFLVETE
jgi:hypothetical protein